MSAAPQIIIISGLSGSGKSTALKALEDKGFFCIDNLPPQFLPKLVELARDSGGEITKIALGADIREGSFLEELPKAMQALVHAGINARLWFFEAAEAVLVRRYSETRRRHPLAEAGEALAEGIRRERERLRVTRQAASEIFDTSALTSHELRALIASRLDHESSAHGPGVTLLSFGYKYGLPLEADMLFDVRFLPNPFYVERLRDLTGEDAEVQDFVLSEDAAREFVTRVTELLGLLLPLFAKEGKPMLTVGVGCTGGKHRSVVIVNALANRLQGGGVALAVRHRDKARDEISGRGGST